MITLAMVVKNEAEALARCLPTVRGLIDRWLIVDTGSTDDTADVVRRELDGIPGSLRRRPWIDFGTNLTEALDLADGSTADWTLRLDADMTVDVHPDFREWLATDPDPAAGAWFVQILDAGTMYQLPLLTRGGMGWQYVGRTHEYLDPQDRKMRPVLGLTVTHHADGSNRGMKHERDIELLREDVEAGDPRAIFYSAQAHECLGRRDEAIELYGRRAALGGFEEESWYAEYREAALRKSVPALLAAWRRRQHRHEPLAEAARLVKAADTAVTDILFREL